MTPCRAVGLIGWLLLLFPSYADRGAAALPFPFCFRLRGFSFSAAASLLGVDVFVESGHGSRLACMLTDLIIQFNSRVVGGRQFWGNTVTPSAPDLRFNLVFCMPGSLLS